MLKKIVLIFLLLVLQVCIPATTTGQPAYETFKPRGTVIRPTKNEGRNEDGRYALVIGNASYKTSPLRNPVNDARDMATSLRRLGFVVIEKENSSRKEMANSIREFGDLIAKGGVGLFYYAGHGMQVKGKNYLIPVNANLKQPKPQPPVVNISDSKSLIILPTDGAIVSHMVQVSGTYSKYNANKDFWLVVQPVQSPQYHPQTSKIPKLKKKNWKSIAYVGQSPKHNIGDEFIIHLVSATKSASKIFTLQGIFKNPQKTRGG